MAKTDMKAASETIADKIAREKAEKEAAGVSQKQVPEQQEDPTEPADKVDPEFEAALNEPDTSTDEDVQEALKQDDAEEEISRALSGDDARSRSAAAAKKLRLIALDFHAASPDSHVIFGRAVERFTLGDLRDLVGLPRAG